MVARRRIAALVVVVALGFLGIATSAAAAVPVEGPWHATTSDGLPVGFEVVGGQIVGTRYRFDWTAYCGTYEAWGFPSVPIEPNGHWKQVDPATGFVLIEATFVAPDLAIGTVTEPSRPALPACPETRASFVAEPGPAWFQPFEALVLAEARGNVERLANAPRRMALKHDGSFRFYGLRWHGFGKPVARAGGYAFLKRGHLVWRPRATVILSDLVEERDRSFRVYLKGRYVLRGGVPRGFRRRGWLNLSFEPHRE